MALGNTVPDKTLQRNVSRKLMQKCSGSTRVDATVRGGEVIVTGTIKHDYERKSIIRCISAVQGIVRVVDQLRLEERKRNE